MKTNEERITKLEQIIYVLRVEVNTWKGIAAEMAVKLGIPVAWIKK
jgi:hypothetical protein